MFRERSCLVVVIGLGLLMGGCAGAKVKGPTDQELVSQVVNVWKAGWEERDVERIVAPLSLAFMTSDGGVPADIREYAERLFSRAGTRMEIILDEMEISTQEGTASVQGVRAILTGSDPDGRLREGLIGLSLRLRKENGGWFITWLDYWNI